MESNLERELKIGALERAGGDDSRTVKLSFSSEEPYERYFGMEILDHGDGAVRLDRLNEIGVLLFNHDTYDVLGKIERAWIEDRRGYAEVTFDDDAIADRIFKKVQSGTLKGVSVRYAVSQWLEVKAGETTEDGFTGPCFVARKWEPLEVSIVSVPADATVGVGRSHDDTSRTTTEEREGKHMNENKNAVTVDGENKSVPVVDVEAERAAAIAAERKRADEIGTMYRDFGLDGTEQIKSGATVEEARAALLGELKKNTSANVGRAEVVNDEEDKFRAAVTDGLLMRSGVDVKNAAEGANSFRGMRLRDIAAECLERDGKSASEVRRMDASDLYYELARGFFNPEAAFPAILDSAIRKTIVEEYQKVPTTFDIWTTKGSVTDFKTTPDHEYVLGGIGDFELIPENGELKHSAPQTSLMPQRKIDTYGKQFSMSRQAFIDDDIGFLTAVPAAYTAAAKKTIDKAVYKLIFNNPAVFDGVNLFHASHNNYISTGTAPTADAIQAIILLAQGQTDQFGDAIYEVPKFLVVPMGYEFKLATIFKSAQVVGSSNNDINPLYNYPLTVVQSPIINALAGANAKPWFMVTDPATSKSIQVDYLNGVETPTFRRSEPAGQLGFVWDIWLDWGISVRDFRGIYRNNGIQ